MTQTWQSQHSIHTDPLAVVGAAGDALVRQELVQRLQVLVQRHRRRHRLQHTRTNMVTTAS
jgi:hypothetical protein